ncbi:MAG: hydantoinase/oxoprolinase family protein [Myxococcales bacterium]|nr:hydantoinase/oxoprolinase family protein [Myxococcales bacterium]
MVLVVCVQLRYHGPMNPNRISLPPVPVAVDTGGTFTDVLCFYDGVFRAIKLPSTPHDPAEAVLAGISELRRDVEISQVFHGSTVATNTLLQRVGAKTALITNQGFRDILLIGRQNRSELYSLSPTKPEPLIPEEWCFEVPGRIAADGQEVVPLDLSLLPDILDRCVAGGVQCIVVSMLHSYRYPAHEQHVVGALQELVRQRNDPPMDISAGSELFPEMREVERTTTAVVNSYVRPAMTGYLTKLENGIAPAKLRVLLSNGGIATPSHAARSAVYTLLSGPAGGVVGATEIMGRIGVDRFMTFDMGGTSTDVALCDRSIPVVNNFVVSQFSLLGSVVDIHTVGAGGGSVAKIDAGGALRVGPSSAGAVPGPACYGKGGTLPTVTDANVVLGLLPAEHFLGGTQPLHLPLAIQALKPLSESLGLSVQDTAQGIRDVANAVMVRALKVISVARGLDPEGFTLVSYGGAGGLHACELASILMIPRVVVPRFPGLLCAMGMLFSDVRVDLAQTVLAQLEPGADLCPATVVETLTTLTHQASRALDDQGVDTDKRVLVRALDVRYVGQSFEITVPFSSSIAGHFTALHQRAYGFALADTPLEIVAARVTAKGLTDPPVLTYARESIHDAVPLDTASRQPFPIYRREHLTPGAQIRGPAIVVEYSGTTMIPYGWLGKVDGYLNIDIGRLG